MRRFGLSLLAVAGLAALPASAAAAIHTGHIAFEEPQSPPSLGAPIIPVEHTAYLSRVSMAYDDQAGTLTITAEDFDPEFWGSVLDPISFELGPRCLEGGAGTSALLEGELHAGSERGRTTFREDPVTQAPVVATVSRRGFAGQLAGAGSFDGQTFVATFSDPGLAGLALRCVTLFINPVETFPLSGYTAPAAPKQAPLASQRTISQLEAAARHEHSGGFGGHDHLVKVHVARGWALATWPAVQPELILFKSEHGRWRVYTFGSAPHFPTAARRALAPYVP